MRHGEVDLRSDTLTQPTPEMLRAMTSAKVGDDAFGEDETTRQLEEYCAELLGKESALFTSTGTMSNQLALRCHTRPGDEVLLDHSYHISFYESAPSSALGQVVLHPIVTADGILDAHVVSAAIDSKPRGPAYAAPRLLCMENSISTHGGRVVPAQAMRTVADAVRSLGLAVHLDGARLANASVAAGLPMAELCAAADTVSLCFAKGLGAPFGSILAGPGPLIDQARVLRKWYGGALHQSGYLAAAALFALKHHVNRLADDHANAYALAERLTQHPWLEVDADAVHTNMVMIGLGGLRVSSAEFCVRARQAGVRLMAWGPSIVRAVTRLGVDRADILCAARRLSSLADVLAKDRDRTGCVPA